MTKLPMPICQLGYPDSQIQEMFGDKAHEFYFWMRGQTYSSCDGRLFDYESNRMTASGCGPHGFVYYAQDVQRFVAGLPVID